MTLSIPGTNSPASVQSFVARLIVLSLAALVVSGAGCATMDVTELKTQSAASYANTAEKNGVKIAVHPVTGKEMKDTFRTDLLSKGVLPILVVAENHSASSSYILAKDRVFVLSGTATNISQQTKVASESGGVAAGVAGAALLSPALLLAGLKMASDATVIQHNLGDKELYSRTLGPGQKAQGFIYYNFPKGAKLEDSYRVLVDLKDAATSESTPFDFKITLTQTTP